MSARTRVSDIQKVYVREPGAAAAPPLPELSRVKLTVGARTLDGMTVPAGRIGAIVLVYEGGEAYEVEFSDPVGALATVPAAHLREVE